MEDRIKNRPTKKQHELLEFIKKFIAEHGYGPSYREIMNGCNYSSVATVALHVDNLMKKGHLRKKDRSARSLEVVTDKTEDAERGDCSAKNTCPNCGGTLVHAIKEEVNHGNNSGDTTGNH